MSNKRFLWIIMQVLFFSGWLGLAGAAASGPLEQMIEGAKKEGAVSVVLSRLAPKSIKRLEREIRATFGVDLKIEFTPSNNMPKTLVQIMMEIKAGAPPSFDLINLSTHAAEGFKAGALERVDWKALITKDTNPEAVLTHPAFHGALAYYTSHHGLLYNPQKVSPDKVPKTFRELADPRWKGRVGIPDAVAGWARRAFILGKEKVYSDISAMLKNGAIKGTNSVLQNRYQLEEIWMAFTVSSYWKYTLDKGMPGAWQCLDYAEIPLFVVTIPTGARHPNAARLVAVYLAGPAGVKFTFEEAGSGNLFYPGNFEHDIRLQNQKQGIREYLPINDAKMIEFLESKDYGKWRKEIKLIMDKGGAG
ncbi:MAG: extracellular solute-binding protein [Desulfobacterales bacterium]|nr:extracellular solute-binding protein [Desulfobacterales bacterium]